MRDFVHVCRSVAPLAFLLSLPTGVSAQSMELASVDSAESQANADSSRPAVSESGRYLVFASEATNLIPGDTNASTDIFVRDLVEGTTTRVSVDSLGQQSNADSSEPAISPEGRFVTFQSMASNLVSGDTNAVSDVFRHDRVTGETLCISVSTAGVQANGHCLSGRTLSADGRWVAFYGLASNLVSGDTNGDFDVFLRDELKGTTLRVQGANQGNSESRFPNISRDGRFVTFVSRARNLVPDDTNNSEDIFLWDREDPASIQRLSLDSAGNQANQASGAAYISADGRFVTFDSFASNLVAGDANDTWDVFVRDVLAEETTLVSISSLGIAGDDISHRPSISPSGRWVVFRSRASTLVTSGANGDYDVFLHDREDGKTSSISRAQSGGASNGDSADGVVSGNLGTIAFSSSGTNLVLGDANSVRDIFAEVRPTASTVLVTSDSAGQQATAESFDSEVSGDARWVVFRSQAGNLVPNDDNSFYDVFRKELASGVTTRLSVNSYGDEQNGNCFEPSVSHDGRVVAFGSNATNLIAGTSDSNGLYDIFARDNTTGLVTVASSDSSGNPLGGQNPAVSADGNWVAFSSLNSNLVPNDTNGTNDVFLKDLTSGTTHRVSLTNDDQQAAANSGFSDVSRDGRFVAFQSRAALVADDVNAPIWDIYVRDRIRQTTILVSRTDAGGNTTVGDSYDVSISADGRQVAFRSFAADLVSGDTNGASDVFVRDMLANTTQRVSISSFGDEANHNSTLPSISPDGRYVVFESDASNLAPLDTNGQRDVFLHDLFSGMTRRLSVSGQGVESNGGSGQASLSACARVASFTSGATNLLDTADSNGTLSDVFVRTQPALGPAVEVYCTAKTNSLGCVPRISYLGNPCPSCADAFLVRADNVLNFKNGLFFYSIFGRADLPFLGGTLCIQPPLRRTPPQLSQGNPPPAQDCSGSYNFNLNLWLMSGLDPFLMSGMTINGQFWSRDPNQTDGTGSGLTDAIEITICP